VGLHERFFAAVYDAFMAGTERAGLRDRRAELLGEADGRVLELGAGTGANLGLYPDSVTELVLLEPSAPMARKLRDRAAVERPDARVVEASADTLPFDDGAFDTVVSTLVLCTVPDPERAIAEVARVLAPGGRLLFLEHVRSDDAKVARRQDRLTPVQRFIGCGCHPNRPTPDLIAASALEVERLDLGRVPKAPAYLRPLAVGVARAR
jgi:ubiquinone/menaquinone biosynthesis C-methylase UbiE